MGGKGISKPQVFFSPSAGDPRGGAGRWDGDEFTRAQTLWGVFSTRRDFPQFFPFCFFFGSERNTGTHSQRYQKADLKNPARGDLLPSTAFS